VAAGAQPPNDFPQTLSATGCMDPDDPALPGPGLIPYGVRSPLFSDGASKERFMAVPDGTNATIDATSGDMDFPVGTIFFKHFRIDGKLVETRMLVRHDQDTWAGYSYEWNDAQTDATLLPAGKSKVLDNGQTWTYPARAACLSCHTQAAGRSLGLEVGQLNGGFTYDSTGIFANQLTTLDHIGIITLPAAVETLPAFPSVNADTASAEDRARAYLHVNCSMCHRQGGTGQSNADMRFNIPFADAHLCNEAAHEGDLGVTNAKLIAPGDPSHSLVSLRTHTVGQGKMPPLARSLVDESGTAAIDEWITSLTACP
jgi:uncharacterized repeat protein (TIGR03806 family)